MNKSQLSKEVLLNLKSEIMNKIPLPDELDKELIEEFAGTPSLEEYVLEIMDGLVEACVIKDTLFDCKYITSRCQTEKTCNMNLSICLLQQDKLSIEIALSFFIYSDFQMKEENLNGCLAYWSRLSDNSQVILEHIFSRNQDAEKKEAIRKEEFKKTWPNEPDIFSAKIDAHQNNYIIFPAYPESQAKREFPGYIHQEAEISEDEEEEVQSVRSDEAVLLGENRVTESDLQQKERENKKKDGGLARLLEQDIYEIQQEKIPEETKQEQFLDVVENQNDPIDTQEETKETQQKKKEIDGRKNIQQEELKFSQKDQQNSYQEEKQEEREKKKKGKQESEEQGQYLGKGEENNRQKVEAQKQKIDEAFIHSKDQMDPIILGYEEEDSEETEQQVFIRQRQLQEDYSFNQQSSENSLDESFVFYEEDISKDFSEQFFLDESLPSEKDDRSINQQFEQRILESSTILSQDKNLKKIIKFCQKFPSQSEFQDCNIIILQNKSKEISIMGLSEVAKMKTASSKIHASLLPVFCHQFYKSKRKYNRKKEKLKREDCSYARYRIDSLEQQNESKKVFEGLSMKQMLIYLCVSELAENCRKRNLEEKKKRRRKKKSARLIGKVASFLQSLTRGINFVELITDIEQHHRKSNTQIPLDTALREALYLQSIKESKMTLSYLSKNRKICSNMLEFEDR